jgi:hypothetical protein
VVKSKFGFGDRQNRLTRGTSIADKKLGVHTSCGLIKIPSDDSARKVIYLAIAQAFKKWTMPIQNWRIALNRFMIEFGDRLPDHQ